MKLIKNWIELAKVADSETHTLDITPEDGSGWIRSKADDEVVEYLSTHTFYGMSYKYYEKLLQKHGFNVQLENWDKDSV
jgi:hypothetical protein